jgi:BMFP domain-containing protein YqiC
VPKPPFENFFDRASEFFSHTTPELERRLKQMVQAALARMDLVTRDEFDAQTRVLQVTRERLEALEKQISEMESAQSEEKKRQPD